jgi:hypothetical protein
MPYQVQRTNEYPDDIDLLVLLERAIAFFKKYRWLFIAAILLGLTAGYLRYRSMPKIYKSTMILHSVILTNQEYIQIVNNWDDLRKGAPEVLAAEFKLPIEQIGKLKKIKADEIQKVFTPTNPNGFFIDVRITDNSILEDLEAGIKRGFEKSLYVSEKIAIRREKFKDLINKTASEINKLDSNKRYLDRIIQGRSPSNSSIIIEGATINRNWIELNEKLQHFTEELKFSNAVEVLQGFKSFRQPIGPNLFVWLFLGLVAFLSIAYIYALIDSLSKRLKARSAAN